MPFDRSLLTPIAGGFDRSLLTPIEPSDEEAQKEQEEILSRPAVPAGLSDVEAGLRPAPTEKPFSEPATTPEELAAKNLESTKRIREMFPGYDVDQGAKTLFGTLTTPIAKMVSPKQLADAIDSIKSFVGADPESTEYGEIVKQALAEPSRKPSTAEEIAAGVQNVAANVTTTPLALALPGAPSGVQRLLAYGFTANQLAHLPESIKEAKEAKTPYERTKAYLGLGLDVGFPLLLGAHEGMALRKSLTTPKGIEGEQEIKTPQESVPTTEPTPPPATPAEPATEPQTPKWTSATAETPLGGQLPMLIPNPVAVAKSVAQLAKQAAPAVKAAGKAVIETGKELAEHTLDIRKVDDQRKAVLNWSAKLQRSFGEAESAQREIQSKVPDQTKREGITNWIQADGDAAVLQQRLNATSDPKLKAGYEAALNLTPEEIGVANDVRNAYGSLGTRGQTYNVLKSFKDNYVTQIWNLRKGPVMAGGRTLRDKFRFSRASTFDTFFDGEQAGFEPKTKDISQLLPVYLHEMNSVIAARQLVSELGKGTASDGRPLVAPRGVAVPVGGSSGQATLVMPKAVKGDTLDYKQIPNQPAFNDWIWAGKDTAGNPVFEKADLALHPEAYKQLKNVLGKSAIKEWYSTSTTPTAAIPKAIVKGLDIAQSETKRTMLGLFAPFHQVQEATHAIGHRVNPTFNVPKIDLVGNAGQMDAAQHGLMLAPDRASANQFMEGFKVSGIVSRIPVIGKAADFYSHYLFHEYIPGLKYKTYEAILARNNEVYAKDLASNKVTPADVKALSAEQANAAYGHLNYADLARNPTIQHILQLGLLAPDFLEARGRFFGQSLKGLAGTKVGREQIIALATLALAQAVTAWTGAQLTDGKWDADRPFEFRKGNRRYTMRSVPEDVSSLLHDSRVFVHSRLSPIIGKGALQYASGYDWRGQKVTPLETTKELAKAPVPLTARGFLGIGNSPLSEWEQLASAAGIKISRYSSSEQIFQLRQKWMENNPDPKIRTLYEQEQKMTLPESIYRPLLLALENEDTAKAKEEYLKLRKERGKSVQDIADYFHQRSERIVTPSERKFRASLTPEQQADYQQYEADRKQIWRRFQNLKSKLATTP